jgi:hypothetical protein
MQQWRSNRSVLGLAVMAVALAIVAVGTSAAPAAAETHHCPFVSPNEPCKGPIESVYAFAGEGVKKAPQLKARFEPISKVAEGNEREGGTIREVVQRQVSWHSAPNVEIVAVFILHRPDTGPRFRYQRIASGKHGGHTTLTDVIAEATSAPVLIIQGRNISGEHSGAPPKSTHCSVLGAPCLGDIHSFYAFSGQAEGATSLLPASLGSEEPAGTDSQGNPLVTRVFHWHSAAGVKLVAAFEVIGENNHGKEGWHVRRLVSGEHGGEATMTMATNPFSHALIGEIPLLVLEGTRTG